VAHASSGEGLERAIHELAPSLKVIAPAREWRERPVDTTAPRDPHLLVRVRVAPAADSDVATVIIGFDSGIPVTVNGVPMELPELIEILSLIGGRYRVSEPNHTPALTLLQRAYRASNGNDAVRLRLQPHSLVVVNENDADQELVSPA